MRVRADFGGARARLRLAWSFNAAGAPPPQRLRSKKFAFNQNGITITLIREI